MRNEVFDNMDPDKVKKFLHYHFDHPEVYKEFKAAAFRMFAVRPYYSHSAIIENIRFNIDLNNGSKKPFQINNFMKAYYARLLISECPEFDGFFALRKMKTTPEILSEEELLRSPACNTL